MLVTHDVGDTATIIADTCHHGIAIGTTVTIVTAYTREGVVEYSIADSSCYLRDADLSPARMTVSSLKHTLVVLNAEQEEVNEVLKWAEDNDMHTVDMQEYYAYQLIDGLAEIDPTDVYKKRALIKKYLVDPARHIAGRG